MPIEIRELIIKTDIISKPKKAGLDPADLGKLRRSIVQEVVQKMRKEINQTNAR